MGDWPKAELREELLSLMTLGRIKESPTSYMSQQKTPLLLEIVPDFLLLSEASDKERKSAVVEVLRYVAYHAEGAESGEKESVGDLLGLSGLSVEEKRQIYEEYKRKDEYNDRPKKFDPHGREMRKIIATRRFDRGHSWLRLDIAWRVVVAMRERGHSNNHYLAGKYWGLEMQAKEAGYVVVTENLARDKYDPDGVMKEWQKTETNRINILNPDFTAIGAACWTPYFAAVFAIERK